jgi:hypothetical protein
MCRQAPNYIQTANSANKIIDPSLVALPENDVAELMQELEVVHRAPQVNPTWSCHLVMIYIILASFPLPPYRFYKFVNIMDTLIIKTSSACMEPLTFEQKK